MATRMFCDGCGQLIELPERSASRDLVIDRGAASAVEPLPYVVLEVGRAKLDLCAAGASSCWSRALEALREALPEMPQAWGAPRPR